MRAVLDAHVRALNKVTTLNMLHGESWPSGECVNSHGLHLKVESQALWAISSNLSGWRALVVHFPLRLLGTDSLVPK